MEVQTGLWADLHEYTFNGNPRQKYILYSAQGYCLYIPANNLDEEGILLPEDQRVYYTYLSSGYRSIEQVNANVVSVPYVPGYEIAGGVAPDTEVM